MGTIRVKLIEIGRHNFNNFSVAFKSAFFFFPICDSSFAALKRFSPLRTILFDPFLALFAFKFASNFANGFEVSVFARVFTIFFFCNEI